jgi:hypothetical protein
VTVESDVQQKKHCAPSSFTDEGIQIDERDKQHMNAPFLMHEMIESDSNVTVERDRHSLKQWSPISATDEGMEIFKSALQPAKAV